MINIIYDNGNIDVVKMMDILQIKNCHMLNIQDSSFNNLMVKLKNKVTQNKNIVIQISVHPNKIQEFVNFVTLNKNINWYIFSYQYELDLMFRYNVRNKSINVDEINANVIDGDNLIKINISPNGGLVKPVKSYFSTTSNLLVKMF